MNALSQIFLVFLVLCSVESSQAKEMIVTLGQKQGDLISATLGIEKSTPPAVLYAYPIPESDLSVADPIKLQRLKASAEDGGSRSLSWYRNGKPLHNLTALKFLYRTEEKSMPPVFLLSTYSGPLKIKIAEEESFYKDRSSYEKFPEKNFAKERGYYLLFVNGESPYELKTQKQKVTRYETEQGKLLWKYIPQVFSLESDHSYIQVYHGSQCTSVTDFADYLGYDLESAPPEEFDRALCRTTEYCVLLGDSKLFAKGNFKDDNTCAEMCRQAQQFPPLLSQKPSKFECKKIAKGENPLTKGKNVKKNLDPEANQILTTVEEQLKEYDAAVAKKDSKAIDSVRFRLSVQFGYLRNLLPEIGILSYSNKQKILTLSKNERFMGLAVEAEARNLLGYIKSTIAQIDSTKNSDPQLLANRKSSLSEYHEQLRELKASYKEFLSAGSVKEIEKALSNPAFKK